MSRRAYAEAAGRPRTSCSTSGARRAAGAGRSARLGLRRLHRRARQRERTRLRLRAALRLRLRERLARLLVHFREDLVLRLAREQALELVLVDRLALDQDVRDAVQVVHVLAEHADRELVAVLDDAPDLVVDLARDLLRVVRLGTHLAAEERHVV